MLSNPQGEGAADFFAQMLEGKATSKFSSVSKLTSVRIPVVDLSAIDAFAELTGSNRNKVIVHLLRVGVEEVIKKVRNPELKEKLHLLQCEKLAAFFPENDTDYSNEVFDSETSLNEKAKRGKPKK